MIKKILRQAISICTGKSLSFIPVIRLEGVIGGKSYGKKGLNLDAIREGLKQAFTMDNDGEEVILILNSPGGSPAQSSLIYQYLCFLKKKYKKKILVFVEDVAASGGYYIACAGDKIYADHHSITGSIGVISGGFGFVNAIEKLGIERRVYTSGENKSTLDPFQPENPDDIAHLKEIQTEIHGAFKKVVTDTRGESLKDPEENEIFTGKFWASEKAKEIGLIDDVTTIEAVMTEKYDEDYRLVKIDTDKRSFLEKKFGGIAHHIGKAFSQGIINHIQEETHSNKISL